MLLGTAGAKGALSDVSIRATRGVHWREATEPTLDGPRQALLVPSLERRTLAPSRDAVAGGSLEVAEMLVGVLEGAPQSPATAPSKGSTRRRPKSAPKVAS